MASRAQRVLMRAKSNIGRDDGGFKYDLQLVPMREYPEIIVPVVSWGASVSGTAREILAATEATDGNGEATVRREAEDFLPLLQRRAEHQPPVMPSLTEAILSRDFARFTDFARDFGKKVFLHGRLRKRKIWGAADS
jgi:hypothetical protein